ncbi:MAG: tetratricopeptide repeat protein [Gammaproteobacteria bacterium]|nr:tetratricopeptide repeat protein [Gammaproteobacteria bacterium]
MEVYNSEEEQIKAIKDWWSENGTSIIVGVVLGVGGFLGYNFWQGQVLEKQQNASKAFEVFTDINPSDKFDEFASSAQNIKQEYSDTGYAVVAALHMAKQYLSKGDLSAAKKELEWAVQQTEGEPLNALMKIRLARVLVAQDDAQAAITLLDNISADSFSALKQQVLGDAYAAKGEAEKAKLAYTLAKESSESYIVKNELEMMINDLSVAEQSTETTAKDSSEVEQKAADTETEETQGS